MNKVVDKYVFRSRMPLLPRPGRRAYLKARELGISTVAVFPEDDKEAMHALLAEEAVQLASVGLRLCSRNSQ